MPFIQKFTLDRISPDIDEVRLVSWTIQEGEAFKSGQVLLEIETDKSVIEIPANADGTLVRQLRASGDTVDFDTPIADIEVAGEPAAAVHHPAPEAADQHEAAADTGHRPPPQDPASKVAGSAPPEGLRPEVIPPASSSPMATTRDCAGQKAATRIAATPAARLLAKSAGLTLDQVQGSGPNHRITRSDVLHHRAERSAPIPAEAFGASTGLAQTAQIESGILAFKTWAAPSSRIAPDSPTVVLLHGIFGSTDTWAATAHFLSKTGLRVVAVDLPAHGQSQCEATRFEDVVTAISQLLDRMIPGPLALIGHSFGAAVATRVARRQADRMQSLSLISPVGLGTEINQAFLDGMCHATNIQALSRELEKLTCSVAPLSETHLMALQSDLAQHRSALITLCASFSIEGTQQVDTRADIRELAVPATIIQGRRDVIIPWQHALNAAPRCALHLLPTAGHMPHWESPEVVFGILERSIR